ncbi:MAG: RHS repeat-associated core domain-containing protein [Phycisphaerales bacterium]|nr:RHS repeat-associated core domain-containing protein [Phycisphaerales bacterium]
MPGPRRSAQRLLYDADGNLTTEFAAGDMNCDGDVTFADTNIFVAKIGCPNITDCNVPCTWTHGDINGDGVLSWDDIDPYIAQLGTAGRKFEWDAENRLIRVGPLHATPAAGDVKVEYAYDYLGRRIERRKYTWQTASPPASWTLAESTRYVWSDWLLLMELDGLQGNAVLRKYTWGLDLSGLNGAGASGGAGVLPAGLTGAGGIGGLLAVYDTNGTTTGQNPEADDMAYAYLYNANGDVGQVVDPNAASAAASLVARYEYDPYGGVAALSGSYAARNAMRFSTKPFDPATGLGYWGYRWYSPKLGRWVSRDPIGEAGGANVNAFVGNAPASGFDAVGRSYLIFPRGDRQRGLSRFLTRIFDRPGQWNRRGRCQSAVGARNLEMEWAALAALWTAARGRSGRDTAG